MKFKLDRTAFSAGKLEDQKNDVEYWLSRQPLERFLAGIYLQSIVYNFDPENPPRMDKTFFFKRKKIYS